MLRECSAMDVTGDYTAQNLSAQRDVITAKECLQSAEVCLALAHKTTKELDTRAALLEFAYEFRTAAKHLERDERELMVRAASPIHGEYASW
jgi:hypothetical protein